MHGTASTWASTEHAVSSYSVSEWGHNAAELALSQLLKQGYVMYCMYVQACLYNNPLIFHLSDGYSDCPLPSVTTVIL